MEYLETTLRPYSRMQDLYQTHYRSSLAAYCEQQNIPFLQKRPTCSAALRFLGRMRNSHRLGSIMPVRLGTAILDCIAFPLGAGRLVDHTVGTYLYRNNGTDLRVCIDAEDSGGIKVPDLLEWSDVYFKTNYWPDRQYDPRVVPLANVNPLVLPRLAELRALRNAEPEWDLFGFFRVWGRIEHSLALFEALARLPCRKKLLAYLISSDRGWEIERLEKAGVDWTTSPMPLPELWSYAARSRLNIVRHGVDDCIPWRMTDMLAMGRCSVLDYNARTRWHIPLVENVHYLSLHVSPDNPMPAADFASRVVERIEGWLSREGLIPGIAGNAAVYFDENLTPVPFGRYVVEQLRRSAAPAP